MCTQVCLEDHSSCCEVPSAETGTWGVLSNSRYHLSFIVHQESYLKHCVGRNCICSLLYSQFLALFLECSKYFWTDGGLRNILQVDLMDHGGQLTNDNRSNKDDLAGFSLSSSR